MNSNFDLQKIADELDFDLEDVEMLFEVFVESTKEQLAQLKQAIDLNNHENIFKLAHSIKGSSANLMLNEISSQAKKIEKEAREHKNIDYLGMYNILRNSIEKIK